MNDGFHGAKAAVFVGENLLVYQRDSHVVWPDMWDFPGGGREGDESAFECLRRETYEEFGLWLVEDDVRWSRVFPAMDDPASDAWFFVVAVNRDHGAHIRFGDEGQQWALMPLPDVMNLPNLVPALRERLSLWLQTEHAGLI